MNTPLNEREIAGLVAVLLSQYWQSDESPELRKLIIGDWLTDVGEFPPEIVADACRQWRQGPERRRRPLSGDIREFCIETQARGVLKLTKRSELTADEIEAAGDNWARSHLRPNGPNESNEARHYDSMAEMQRDPGFKPVVIKIGPGKFHRFDPIEPAIVDVVPVVTLPRIVEMPAEVKRHLTATMDAVKAKQEFALPDDIDREREVMAAE